MKKLSRPDSISFPTPTITNNKKSAPWDTSAVSPGVDLMLPASIEPPADSARAISSSPVMWDLQKPSSKVGGGNGNYHLLPIGNTSTLPETNSHRTWKLMVGVDDSFPFGASKGLFSGVNSLLVLGRVPMMDFPQHCYCFCQSWRSCKAQRETRAPPFPWHSDWFRFRDPYFMA